MRAFTALASGLALLVAAGSSASAQATDTTKAKPAAATIVGKWTGAVESPNGAMEMTAVIKKDSTGYAGTMSSQQGEMALYDITVDGENVSAGATMNMQGTNIDLWYTFVLKGDTMTGSIAANFQGQSMSFPLVLRRVSDK